MTKYKKLKRYPKYEISKAGEIRHIETKRMLKPTPSFNGHLRVKLNNKTEYVGRLVAETYIIKKDCSHTDVRYLDGNKRNTNVDNLEWATHHQTQYDSFGVGTNAPGGSEPPKPVLDNLSGIMYPSIRACSRAVGISPVNIRRLINRGTRFTLI